MPKNLRKHPIIRPRKKRGPISRGPGRCVRCGKQIPSERLRLIPGTLLCTGCQRAEEL